MVISNNIISRNLIIVKKLINNWQIASISHKKKKKLVWKIRVNSTWLATRLDSFKNDPFWPATRITCKPDYPDPNLTHTARFATSSYEISICLCIKVLTIESDSMSHFTSWERERSAQTYMQTQHGLIKVVIN